jgi:hypothetical protein
MAKQKGIIQIVGTIGNVTGRRTKDGFIIQEKPGPTREQVLNDPEFEETRKMYTEFGGASKGAKILQDIFLPAIFPCKDNVVHHRLTTLLRQVINTDTASAKGQRCLSYGESRLLKGFSWNIKSDLWRILGFDIKFHFETEDGEVIFHIPAYVPANQMKVNPSATHYRITISAAELSWQKNGPAAEMFTTDYMPVNNERTFPLSGMLLMTPGTTKPIAICVKVDWHMKVNKDMWPSRNSKYNAAGIVEVL